MPLLPITRMTLYKHGVGFFERRALLAGEQVELSFRVEEMNDILKSLTAIDRGKGKVLGVDYATPQTQEERLSGCSIRLGDDRSLQDMLRGLRGRQVTLMLDQGQMLKGHLLGIDEVSGDQPIHTTLVSILADENNTVSALPLERLQGVEILDERGAGDLRFFLQTSLGQENYRQVTIRLTPGEHDLLVSYIAPAPTWRVSYRLALEDSTQGHEARALLLGWGIFDNRLEEDLNGISLSLVAGMPISFVYDLYTPFIPQRPTVKEEGRVAAAPVGFEGAIPLPPAAAPMMAKSIMPAAPQRMHAAAVSDTFSLETMQSAMPAQASGENLGELFQYTIETPVSVGRGQSAMVPITTAFLNYQKELLYNAAKLPEHPVATLRMKNTTGLTLERGPVTVLESGEYIGEAVLAFTGADGEIVIPYAVELSIKISEDAGTATETFGIHISGELLHFESWEIHWRACRVINKTNAPAKILIEHPRSNHYDVYDSPEPKEKTLDMLRFEVEAQPNQEVVLRISERRLVTRREELRKQSLHTLQQFMKQGLINSKVYNHVAEILRLFSEIQETQQKIQTIEKERQDIYKQQQQIQGNMGALNTTGKEGDLRARYVSNLEASEEKLREAAEREAAFKAHIQRLEAEIQAKLADLPG